MVRSVTPRETLFVDDRPPDELLLTTEQRNVLAGIAYLLAQCESLHARGLIAGEALETIRAEYADRRAAIETHGFCEAALADARRLMVPQPSAACARADRARALDPARPEAWALAIEARKGWKDDEALALAAEAVARFPGFPVTPADLQHERDVREARAEQQRAADAAADLLAKARAALDARRDEEVVELTGALLDRQPGHFETRVLRAFALQRLNRLDEALAVYQQLAIQQGGAPVWVQWVHQIEGRLEMQRRRHPVSGATAGPHPGRSELRDAMPIQPRVSWGSITGEFLKGLGQKPILCLAVLLIVGQLERRVVSTARAEALVAAGQVHAARLHGDVRGTRQRPGRAGGRAGRLMRLTTLIHVPFHNKRAGEMRFPTEPTRARVVVLVLDSAALGVLIWRVVAALGLPRAGRATLIAALFAISLTHVAARTGRSPRVVFLLPSARSSLRPSVGSPRAGATTSATSRRSR